MMEAAVRSGVREQVLCIVSGTFGERFADVAERCDKQVVRLHVPRGGVLEPELLEQMLDGPPIDAVTMVHSETSTGALAPVQQLIARLRQLDDVVTIVDAVSSVGGMAIEADRWGADFLFTGSQKAIGLPPGLAFAVASERFIERASAIDDRGFYLDVIDLLSAAEESRFPQTPALPVVYALEAQLVRIAQRGPRRPLRAAPHHARACRSLGHPPRPLRNHGARGPAVRHRHRALTLRPDLSATAVARTLAPRAGRSPSASMPTRSA